MTNSSHERDRGAGMTRPSLLFHCQHSLGFGHLARAWTIAGALASEFRVTLWCGGLVPHSLAASPAPFDVVELPPMAMNEDGRLVSLDPRYSVEKALDVRRDLLLRDLATKRPAVLVVELFPFGRKKFERELVPLLEAAQTMSPRPLVVCSLRDILVARGGEQRAHDERARMLADRYFDAVLVHADPAFVRLDECFRPIQPMRTPVHYTGFVAGRPVTHAVSERNGILVSGGGGRFAESLFMAAIEAHRRARRATVLTIVAGPLCDVATWQRLYTASSNDPSIRLRRTVTDLSAEMAASQLSISQCGYNTALDIVRARVPALVVPFAERGETEQTDRARRLEALGVLRVLTADRLTADTLAAAIDDTLSFQPAQFALDLSGADRTTHVLKALADGEKPAGKRHLVVHAHLA
jgi:predicted glycosyltransferase